MAHAKQARRYHWLSEGLKSFVDDPHAAIDGMGQGEIINLADRRAEASRCAQLDLLSTLGPDKIAREYAALELDREERRSLPRPTVVAASHHADTPRRPKQRCDCTAASRQPCCRRGSRAKGFFRFAVDARRRRADGAGPGDGHGSDAWHAVPFHGSCPIFDCAWR